MKFSRLDWYPWDFDEDPLVQHLSWQEQSFYMRVLTEMWKWSAKHDTVDIPNDDWLASGAVRIPYKEWVKLRVRLVDHPAAPLKCDAEAGVIYSRRLRDEYAKAVARSQSHTERGKKGGRPKSSNKPIAKLQVSNSLPIAKLQPSNSQAIAGDHLSFTKEINKREILRAPARWNAELPPDVSDMLSVLDDRPQHQHLLIADSDLLVTWHAQGMEWAVIMRALTKIQQEDKPFAYAAKMLKRWHEQGIHHESDLIGNPTKAKQGGSHHDRNQKHRDAGRHDDQDSLDDIIQGR